MHLSKGYRVITLTWDQYLKAFTKETGQTISERQARTAKNQLLHNDKIRQTFKVVERYGRKFKYMQIILGKASSLWGNLQSKVIKAKKALLYNLSGQSRKYYQNVKDLLLPAIDSYDVIKERYWKFNEKKEIIKRKNEAWEKRYQEEKAREDREELKEAIRAEELGSVLCTVGGMFVCWSHEVPDDCKTVELM